MPSVTLAPQPPAARFIFRGGAAAAVGTADVAFGLELPQQAGRAAEAGGRAALWLGPDEWLLIAPAEDRETVGRAIAGQLGALPHSLVEVSDRQVAMVAAGADAALALSAGCPLDLDIAAFPIGACTRTVLGKAEIVLWRRGEDSFHIEVWRSYAPYLTAFLDEAVSGL